MPLSDRFSVVKFIVEEPEYLLLENTTVGIHLGKLVFVNNENQANLRHLSREPTVEHSVDVVLRFQNGKRIRIECADEVSAIALAESCKPKDKRRLSSLPTPLTEPTNWAPKRGTLLTGNLKKQPPKRSSGGDDDFGLLSRDSLPKARSVKTRGDMSNSSRPLPMQNEEPQTPAKWTQESGNSAALHQNSDLGHFTPLSADVSDEYARKRARIDGNSVATPEKNRAGFGFSGGRQYPVRERPQLSSALQLSFSRRTTPAPQSSAAYRGYRSSHTFGLQNLGNTCYLNAVMQAACSLREFVADLKAMSKSIPLVSDGRLFQTSVDILSQMSKANSGVGPLSPARLRELIAESAPMFAGRQQQDAHEFLLEYVNQLHDEMLGARKTWLEINEDTIQIVEDTAPLATQLHLDSEITKRLECVSCKSTRGVVERFRDFSLDFPADTVDLASKTPSSGGTRDKCELRAMLASYFEAEMLEARCEKCAAAKAIMEKQLTLAPKVLVLHLKRFVPNFEKQRYDKSNQDVQIPLQFDLKSYLGQAFASGLDEGVDANAAPGRSSLPARPFASEGNTLRQVWEFYAGDGWQPMLPKQARYLSEQLAANVKSCVMETDGRTYTIDFEKMEQVNSSSGSCRPIRQVEERGPVYELRSIVAHDGASPQSGHYVCYARGENKNWRLYDDSLVTDIPADRHPERSLGRRAYVLFYVLQESQ